ncbi:MAG: HDIG domain-containing protein [Bacillota bacterium]|nr:HDIG domain-containing protein [Bacillota bacterium]
MIFNRIKEKDRFLMLTVFISTFIITCAVVVTSFSFKRYDLKEGDIAKTNIKAQREIIDEASTSAAVKKAVDAVPLQYNKNYEVKSQVLSQIDNFFKSVINVYDLNLSGSDKAKKVNSEGQIIISQDILTGIFKMSKDNIVKLQDDLTQDLDTLYDDNIENKNEEIKKAKDTLIVKINGYKISSEGKEIGYSLIDKVIQPNFFYDEEKTNVLRQAAKNNVKPVTIKKDQIIVKEGEPVSKGEIITLNNLGLLKNNNKFDFSTYLVSSMLVLIIMFLEGYYLFKFQREVFRDWKKLSLISALNITSLILARTITIISPFLIPAAFAPMLLTLLLDYKMSIVISCLNAVLIAAVVGFNIEVAIVSLLASLVGALALKKLQERNDIIYSSLFIGVIIALITLTDGFLLSNNMIDIFKRTGYALIGSLLSGVLTIGFLPLFENIFDVVTTIKLLELSNPNNPLLKKLLMEAPGTYHHSVLVANLAEVATESIGGNQVLARVASYYHDIGKVKRPYFFNENQMGNDNPHNKITPNLSTLIITSHVKDGIELAKEFKLPKVIQDIIEQHHGTTLVKYFYLTMKNKAEKPEEIKEEDFRYGGPIPFTKEAGVIMLADSVEASVRSIQEPTKGKIEEMVNNIIKDRLNDGQLDNCDITLKDLNKIREAFYKVLSGVYHQRIEYPEDKWKRKEESNDTDKQ